RLRRARAAGTAVPRGEHGERAIDRAHRLAHACGSRTARSPCAHPDRGPRDHGEPRRAGRSSQAPHTLAGRGCERRAARAGMECRRGHRGIDRANGRRIRPGEGAMTGWLAAAIVPAVVAWLLAGWMRGASLTAGLADRPNERSLHDVPRRRVGGLALMLAALPVAAWFADDALRAVLA